jgi:hypothetical protein
MNKKYTITALIFINACIFAFLIKTVFISTNNAAVPQKNEVIQDFISPARNEKNLFQPLTKDPFKNTLFTTEKQKVVAPVKKQPSEPFVSLTGIMYDDDNSEAIIRFVETSETSMVKNGDAVFGVKVIEIAKDYIIIEQTGTMFKLKADYYEEVTP